MSYTAKDSFNEWYKKIDVVATAEVLAFRTEAINKILEYDDQEFWLDVIRIHYSLPLPTEQNKSKLISEFKKTDLVFPILDNAMLINVLASIILCFKLEDDSEELNTSIALAIINCNFLEHYKKNDVPVYEHALKFLKNSDSRRKVDYSALTDKIVDLTHELSEEDDETNLSKKKALEIAQIIKLHNVTQKVLLEESNVMWWLFSLHSKICDKNFSEIGSANILISARELYDLTQFSQVIDSGMSILNRVLLLSNDNKPFKNSSLFEAVNALDEPTKEKLLNGLEGVSTLTPCLLAVQKSLELNSDDDWAPLYKKASFGADVKKKKHKSLDIAYQMYKELIFIKSLI
jgi:GTPase-associated system helical domain